MTTFSSTHSPDENVLARAKPLCTQGLKREQNDDVQGAKVPSCFDSIRNGGAKYRNTSCIGDPNAQTHALHNAPIRDTYHKAEVFHDAISTATGCKPTDPDFNLSNTGAYRGSRVISQNVNYTKVMLSSLRRLLPFLMTWDLIHWTTAGTISSPANQKVPCFTFSRCN